MSRYNPSPKSRGATIVIAAHDTPPVAKKNADFICSGSNDQVIINQAVNILRNLSGDIDVPGSREITYKNQGGTILLLSGGFHISGAIDLSGVNDITLAGVGPATVIKNEATNGANAIQAINTGNSKNRVIVRDLMVVGNPLSGDGIYLRECTYREVLNVFSISNGGCGLRFVADTESGGADNNIVTNSQFLFNKLDGFRIEGRDVHETLVSQCHFEENYRYNISTNYSINLHISNCSIEDCYGEYEIYLENQGQLQIDNCVIEGSVSIKAWDAAEYIALISNCDINGEVKYEKAPTYGGGLRVSNSRLVLRTVDASRLHLSNCSTQIAKQIDGTAGYIKVSNQMTVTGGEMVQNTLDSFEIEATATNARIIFTGVSLHNFKPTIKADPVLTLTRLQMGNCHFRTCNFNVDGIQIVSIQGGEMTGSASMSFSNIAEILHFGGVILHKGGGGLTITVNETCTGKIAFIKNVISQTVNIVDRTGTAIIDNV